MILVLLLSLILGSLAWTIMHLEINARKARALNVPLVRIPFDLNNYVWVIIQSLFWAVLACLPICWSSYPDFVRFSHRNWHFIEKSVPTDRFGPVWALVSPGGVHLYVSDADAIANIYSRWRDFSRPVHMYQMLNVFGPSVFTVGLQDWVRHRKAVAAPFNQSIMMLVWDTTLAQTQYVFPSYLGITGIEQDMRTLSLNVLAATAFREPYNFKGSVELDDCKTSHDNYRDSLYTVHKYALYLMLIPYRLLTGRMIPRYLAQIGRAAQSLESQMTEKVTEEIAAVSKGEHRSSSLITHLVHAASPKSDDESMCSEDEANYAAKCKLSADEILGNIFVINFAGLDTTAITLSFSEMLLAAHPEVQEWLREEVIEVFQSTPISDWDYNSFARLKRCRAVFLETLRLYGPITGLPKMTSENTTTLHVGGRVLVLPPRTETYLYLLGVHTDARYWDDPHTWKPSRWIVGSTSTKQGSEEEILTPQKGSFCPWAGGAQGCVGKEFSQVEGVAVLACLFRAHLIRPKRMEGETVEQARDRARSCVNDFNYQLLLQMNHADRVRLECYRSG